MNGHKFTVTFWHNAENETVGSYCSRGLYARVPHCARRIHAGMKPAATSSSGICNNAENEKLKT